MRTLSFLAALAGALTLTGTVGVFCAAFSLEFSASGILWFLALGGGLGFVVSETIEGILTWRERHVSIRLDQARAWASELANQERERKLQEPVAVLPGPPSDRGWPLAIEITLFCGQVSGFTDAGLEQVMGSDGRPRMQRFLLARGVLALGPSGYGWADGVTLEDALRRLRLGDLTPFPDEPAPEVIAPANSKTQRHVARRAATAAKAVIIEQ